MSLISPCREWQNSIRQKPQLKIILVASIFIGRSLGSAKSCCTSHSLFLSISDSYKSQHLSGTTCGSNGKLQARLEEPLRDTERPSALSSAPSGRQGLAHSPSAPSRPCRTATAQPLRQPPGQTKFAFRIMAQAIAGVSGTRERLSFVPCYCFL